MRRCDAVVLVPNWRDSVGARSEVDEADRLGIEIIGRSYVRANEPPHTQRAADDFIISLTMTDLRLWRERMEKMS
jgi:hypothetical protein